MADRPIYAADGVSRMKNDDKVYVNTGNNLRQIAMSDLAMELYRNMLVYGHTGKNLGSSYTAEQKAQVKAGTFENIAIGDYWSINGVTWRVWDIDWYLNKGDTACNSHHLVVIPDNNILTANGTDTHWMNATNTTDGGYANTDYRTTHKASCVEKIKAAFGDYILVHRELICHSCSNGTPSSWNWFDADVELPSEVMMYGSRIWGNSGYNIGTAYPQLKLAMLDPSRVINREHYWLRDVAGASQFAHVGSDGYATFTDAFDAWVGVRPFFLLRG